MHKRKRVALPDMNATHVSSTGKIITIVCDDHDTKDAILNVLTSGAGERMERASTGLPIKRRANESPVQYYRRTKRVDDNFTRVWRGWYYCNPAHCKHRWRSKKERDKHLDMAYAALT